MALSPCFSNAKLVVPRICAKPNLKLNILSARNSKFGVSTNCGSGSGEKKTSALVVGTPIVVVDTPKMIKTAATMPCLRANDGLLKPGDVGRIVSRKPKDVWAVRFAKGTFLVDGKYFKHLLLDQ